MPRIVVISLTFAFCLSIGIADAQKAMPTGVDVNARYYGGSTALMRAASEGETETVKALLANGADVNAKDNDGDTALMMAALWGETETVKALLANGADINAKENEWGKTTLMRAALWGRTETVKVLLAKGADINAKSDTGRTALMDAASKGQIEIVEVLLAKGADINAKSDTGRTALMDAASEGQIEIVEVLLAKGADVNAIYNDLGYTALIEAAARGHAKTVEVLLAKGADANAKDVTGKTALMYAEMGKYAKTVEVLLAEDSDSNNKSGIDIKGNISSKVAVPNNSAEREWLIMVYMSGVNDLGILGYVDKNINAMESVNFTDKVFVVAKYNAIRSDENNQLQFQDNSETVNIRHDSNINKITSPVEGSKHNSDMGEGNHLYRFARWNMLRFPAKKTMLIIWGHGGGHRGIAYDDVSNNHISVTELGLALKEITETTGRKLDIFATDASFMQMAGVAYEIKDYAKVIVGSEKSIPGQGYPYKSILTDLNNNPEMDARELGNIIVRDYGDYYSDKEIDISTVRNYGDYNDIGGTTISAIDAAMMPQFIELLNNWVNSITSNDDDLKKVANLSVSNNVSYFGSFNVEKVKGTRSIDLCDFIDHIGEILPDGSQAKEDGEILRDFVTNNLIISNKGTGTKRTCGMACYMPKRIDSYYNNLIFARASRWDDFIRSILIILEGDM